MCSVWLHSYCHTCFFTRRNQVKQSFSFTRQHCSRCCNQFSPSQSSLQNFLTALHCLLFHFYSPTPPTCQTNICFERKSKSSWSLTQISLFTFVPKHLLVQFFWKPIDSSECDIGKDSCLSKNKKKEEKAVHVFYWTRTAVVQISLKLNTDTSKRERCVRDSMRKRSLILAHRNVEMHCICQGIIPKSWQDSIVTQLCLKTEILHVLTLIK